MSACGISEIRCTARYMVGLARECGQKNETRAQRELILRLFSCHHSSAVN